MLDTNIWRELGGEAFSADLLGQDEGEAFQMDLRRATCAGKTLGSKEFRAELNQQVVELVEYHQRMAAD